MGVSEVSLGLDSIKFIYIKSLRLDFCRHQSTQLVVQLAVFGGCPFGSLLFESLHSALHGILVDFWQMALR